MIHLKVASVAALWIINKLLTCHNKIRRIL